MENESEPIIQRLHKLKDAINGCGINLEDAASSRHLLAHEGLLDAVALLYEECISNTFTQTPAITAFIKKYKDTIEELHRLRVNINDFEQKKVIGKGNFGIVQVVREKQTGSVYAMKTLRKAETLVQQHIAFYEEERDIMAKSDTQWITKLQYTFQDDKNLYLVMEFHPGGDLLSLLDRFEYRFTEDMIQFYLSEIITSLHVLHTMGYVHRDVKPENILIDRCGHVKLADFGSSAKLSKTGFVESKMPIGTPDYLAPEVLAAMNDRKETKSYGIECDFWSVGVIAYEMFYGETPFHAVSVGAIYNKIMNYEKSLSFNSNIPVTPELKNIIKRFLCGGEERIIYGEIIQHKFFLYTDWHNLQSVRPPFIPLVTSLDDTSNFEDFDNERPLPDIEEFRTPANVFGSDLPFIGFTYSRPSNNNRVSLNRANSSILNLEESRRNSTHLEEQLASKKKELHDAKLQLKDLEGGEKSQEAQQFEKRAVIAETKLSLVEKERKRLEEELKKKELLLQKSRQDLTNEKAQRAKTESKTLEFLRDIKDKWKREEAMKISNLTEKIEIYQKGAETINDAKKAALENLHETTLELNKVKSVLLKYKTIVKQKDEVIDNMRRQSVEVKCSGTCRTANDLSMELEKASCNLKTEITKRDVMNKDFDGLKSNLRKQDDIIVTLQESQREADRKVSQAFNQLELKNKEIDFIRRKEDESRKKETVEKSMKLQETEELLKKERTESKTLKRKLDDVTMNLHNCLETQSKRNTAFQIREANLQAESQKLQQDLTHLSKEKEDINGQLVVLAKQEGIQKSKIEELEELMTSLKETLTKLESKKIPEGERSLKAQIQLLEKQLNKSQSAGEADREKLHIAEENLRKKQREFADLKLDYRGSERELKSAQDTVKFLRENNRELRAQVKEKEEDIKVLQTKECELYEEAKRISEIHNDEMKAKENNIKDNLNEISDLKREIQSAEDLRKKVQDGQYRLLELQSACDQAKVAKRAFECDQKTYERNVADLEATIVKIKQESEELQEKLNGANNMVKQLKDICSEQDQQLDVVDGFNWRLQEAEDEKKLLEEQIEHLQSDIKLSKVATNEETSLKLFQEKKVRDLERKLHDVKEDNEGMTMTLQQVKDEYANQLAAAHAQIGDLQDEISEIMTKLRAFEHQLIDTEGQAEMLKEESAGHIEHIRNMRESNFMLTDGLEEAISKGEMFKKRILELENEVASASAIAADKELRMGSTIQQQTKLIDFLQSKTENPPKKKIALSRLFGASNNKENTYVARCCRDLRNQLATEKMHIQNISSQLSKAHTEISTLRAKDDMKDIPRVFTTPLKKSSKKLEECSSSSIDKSSKARMRHRIPHRWNSHLAMRAGKCAGCMGSIPFSMKVSRCRECQALAHNKCCGAIAHTCGLPKEFASHFTASCRSPTRKRAHDQIVKSGWIKVLKRSKAYYERRYAILSACQLQLYDQKPVNSLQPVKTFELDSLRVLVTRSIYKSELPNSNSSELPFVLKVSFDSKKGQSSSIFILSQSFEEKRMWSKAFESFHSEAKSEDCIAPTNGVIRTTNLVSLKSPDDMDCNCIVTLSEKIVLVGATEGLFSFELNNGSITKRSRINGFDSVQQIVLSKQIGVAVFVAGPDNLVYVNDLLSLSAASEALSTSKPGLSPKLIPTLIGCHLIAASHTKQAFLCAASSDRISILTWDNSSECFEVRREYGTLEPCSCLLFTATALIVGSERFYKIDLNNYAIEELLDEKDNTLAYALFGSTQMASYPVSVIQISEQGAKDEFLLAFYEFGIFVDENGRRTRDSDVKFVRLPLGLSFISPHLFILYENAIEVIEISPHSFMGLIESSSQEGSNNAISVTKQLKRARLLGDSPCQKGVAISTNSHDVSVIQTIQASFNCDQVEGSNSCLRGNAATTEQATANASDTLSLRSEDSLASVQSSSSSSSTIGSTKRTGNSNVLRSSKRTKKNA